MDKNKIKSFAIWARRNLISAVSERANRIGVTENKIEEAVAVQGGFKLVGNDEIFKLSKGDRDKLVDEVKGKGFEQVMEEVAYTWFNRFMGLRYMEVNDYLPTGIRVLSSKIEGKTEADVLTRVSEVIEELNLNSDYIYELLDSGKAEDREEAYKYILVRQCNELGNIIPQMFEKISDYTELLLPDNLLEEGSIIRKMVEDIGEEDWKEEVEIIGWMYQYYISEKKDAVFAALKNNVKITKENIPAATQLFTPKWIVKYMVENSLGRLWLEGHPNEELQKEWKYYLEEAQQEPQVEEELKKIRDEHTKLTPEDIKVLDPCMGSGHILVYAFDVLYEIYKTAGYSEREIPRMILQNNLYGLDIDDRAAQLASFALIMKARHYNRRLFREMEREGLELNLCSIQESNSIHKEAIDYFCSLETGLDNDELENDLKYLWSTFMDAKEYGSILEVQEVNFEALKQRLRGIEDEDNFMFGDYRKMLIDKLPMIIKQAEIMSRKYEICITNPPYMGTRGMNNKLSIFLKTKHDFVKSDLFSTFINRNFRYTKSSGYIGLMTPNVWMFILSYESLREEITNNKTITSLVQLSNSGFTDATVFICAFTILNCRTKAKGEYIRLVDYKGVEMQEEKTLEATQNKKCKYRYSASLEQFKAIPGKPIAYWVENTSVFEGERIGGTFVSGGRNKTHNNDKYMRYHWEIDVNNKKWKLYCNGGEYKKYFGSDFYVFDWSNEAKEFYKSHGGLCNEKFWNKEGITWNCITSSTNAFKKKMTNSEYSSVSPTIFNEKFKCDNTVLGFLNSKVSKYLLDVLNPTLYTAINNILNLPNKNSGNRDLINKIVEDNIRIAKLDWDLYEFSIDFRKNPFLDIKKTRYANDIIGIDKICDILLEDNKDLQRRFKENEERLNQIFIDMYHLNGYILPSIDERDITIYKVDRDNAIRNFISYSVGCMLGRYSIDVEGRIYAGGEFKDKWNLEENKVRNIEKDEEGNTISDLWIDGTFLPDADNVIPITEDEYFEDDIIARFIEFVRTVYSEETLEGNLDFIADSIGRKPSETARKAIRRYFIKDFYKDHLKVYQKRPIYWLFDSGKNDGFKALVYMHRYNDQTVAKVRTDYLHTLQRKYEGEMQRQQLIVDSEEYTAKDRTSAKKKIDRITKQIEECREYDQVVAHLANEKISIDLDDGVKVNYAKFQHVKLINSKGKDVEMDLLAKI